MRANLETGWGETNTDLNEEIRQRVDLVALVGEFVSLRKQGRNYVGLCPFHPEKTPSFTVSAEKQMFYCFGCGVGGNAYTFLMKLQNLSFTEAREILAARSGVELTRAAKKENSQRQRLLEINSLAAEYYQGLLNVSLAGKEAREYLARRGINKEAAVRFGLGYAPQEGEALLNFLVRKSFKVEEIAAAGLVVPRREGGFLDRFRDRLIFPIFNPANQVIGFGGRVLGKGEPKYLNTPETPLFQKGEVLYALNWALPRLRERKQAVIVEGYLDALTAHLYGFTNVVASLGTALTKGQAQLLRRYVEKVVVAYDADSAGEAATLRSLEIFRAAGLQVLGTTLPPGKDPDEYLRSEGRAAFQKLIEDEPLPLFLYKLEKSKAGRDLGKITERIAFANLLLPDLAKVENKIERAEYLRILAQTLNLSPEAIAAELAKYLELQLQDKKVKSSYNRSEEPFLNLSGSRRAQQKLLQFMLVEKELRDRISSELGWDFCEEPAAREILEAIARAPEKEAGALLAQLETEEAQELCCRLLFQGEKELEEKKPPSSLVSGNIKKVKLGRLQAEIEKRKEEINQAERDKNLEQLKELLLQITELQRSLHQLKIS